MKKNLLLLTSICLNMVFSAQADTIMTYALQAFSTKSKGPMVQLLKILMTTEGDKPGTKSLYNKVLTSPDFYNNDKKALDNDLQAAGGAGIDASRYAGKSGNAALDEVIAMFTAEGPGNQVLQKAAASQAQANTAAAAVRTAIGQAKR